jgi:ABC-type Mn2+/Zn2+ transport system ATPase subunit
MKTRLTVKNYRCFVRPTTVEIAKGLTAFIGTNNADKSTLMRFLLELRPILASVSRPGPDMMNLLYGNRSAVFEHVADPNEVFSNVNQGDLEFWFDFIYERPTNHLEPTRVHFVIARRDQRCRMRITTNETLNVSANHNFSFVGNALQQGSTYKCDLSEICSLAEALSSTLYIGPFRNALNIGGMGNYFDIQIGEQFIASFRHRKTGPQRQLNMDVIDLIEDIRRIFEFQSLAIEPSADDKSLHITVNNKPYKQNELGSGILQFVIVLANAVSARKDFILIDEPELNLHPRLQLDFLTTLESYAGQGVWFATHSIGLARSAADRIYSVVRERNSDSAARPFEATPRLAEFLGEMSFSSHQEIGFEKILLVEGPTEVRVIQQFLRKMKKDHVVVLLPLHGRFPQEEEIGEVLRLTPKLAALIDSERGAPEDALSAVRHGFLELCKAHEIPAHVLERRATENYFPDSVIKAVFGAQYRGLEAYERFQDVQPHWSKADNWRAAAAMDLAEIMKTDFGQFLNAL